MVINLTENNSLIRFVFPHSTEIKKAFDRKGLQSHWRGSFLFHCSPLNFLYDINALSIPAAQTGHVVTALVVTVQLNGPSPVVASCFASK